MSALDPSLSDLEKASIDALLRTGDSQRQAVTLLFVTATLQLEQARELAKEVVRLHEEEGARGRELVSLRRRLVALEDYQRRVIEAAAPVGYAIVDESVLPAFSKQTSERPAAQAPGGMAVLRIVPTTHRQQLQRRLDEIHSEIDAEVQAIVDAPVKGA